MPEKTAVAPMDKSQNNSPVSGPTETESTVTLDAAGSVVVAAIEGTRPILVELQALVSGAAYGNPQRKAMGIDAMTGSLEPGKMADVVLWNGDPLSVYSRPEKVWVDGALMYDSMDPKRRPVSDFELGLPGAGDVK